MTDAPKPPIIEVLGAGCATCKKLHEISQRAADELGIHVTVGYVTDVQRIVALGLASSPVLVVDGTPAYIGFTPDIERIKKAMTDALERTT